MQNWSDLKWPKNDFSAVPYPVFYDKDVYDAEQERIFRGPLWCYTALQAEIPNPGDYKPRSSAIRRSSSIAPKTDQFTPS